MREIIENCRFAKDLYVHFLRLNKRFPKQDLMRFPAKLQSASTVLEQGELYKLIARAIFHRAIHIGLMDYAACEGKYMEYIGFGAHSEINFPWFDHSDFRMVALNLIENDSWYTWYVLTFYTVRARSTKFEKFLDSNEHEKKDTERKLRLAKVVQQLRDDLSNKSADLLDPPIF